MARLVGGGRQQQPQSAAVSEAPMRQHQAPFSADEYDYTPFQGPTYQVSAYSTLLWLQRHLVECTLVRAMQACHASIMGVRNHVCA